MLYFVPNNQVLLKSYSALSEIPKFLVNHLCTKFVTDPHRTNCADMTLKDPAVDVINVNCCYVSQVLTIFGALCIPDFVSTSSKPLCFTSFSSNCDWNQKSDIFREHKYICFRVIIIQLYGIRIIFSDFWVESIFSRSMSNWRLGTGGFQIWRL